MTRRELARKIANKFNLSIAESDRILQYTLAEMKTIFRQSKNLFTKKKS